MSSQWGIDCNGDRDLFVTPTLANILRTPSVPQSGCCTLQQVSRGSGHFAVAAFSGENQKTNIHRYIVCLAVAADIYVTHKTSAR